MTESADRLPLAGFRQAAEAASLPLPLPLPLPDGKFLVGALHASQQLKKMQTLLVHAPGDRDTFSTLHGQALDAWCIAEDQFNAFHADRECKGQA